MAAACSPVSPAATVVLPADDILVTDSEAAAVIRVDPRSRWRGEERGIMARRGDGIYRRGAGEA